MGEIKLLEIWQIFEELKEVLTVGAGKSQHILRQAQIASLRQSFEGETEMSVIFLGLEDDFLPLNTGNTIPVQGEQLYAPVAESSVWERFYSGSCDSQGRQRGTNLFTGNRGDSLSSTNLKLTVLEISLLQLTPHQVSTYICNEEALRVVCVGYWFHPISASGELSVLQL